MAGRQVLRRAVALVATVAAGVAPGWSLANPASAEGEVTVTWPTPTKINPDTMGYEVVTSGTDPATDHFFIYAFDGSSADHRTVPVEADGSTELAFAEVEGRVKVSITRCAPHCFPLAADRYLELRTRLDPSPGDVFSWGVAGPAEDRQEVTFEPHGVTAVDATWQVFEHGTGDNGEPLTTGSVEDAAVPFTLPPLGDVGWVHGKMYEIQVSYEADTDWGRLRATTVQPFTWDEHADLAVRLSADTVYPVEDDYVDELKVWVEWGSDVPRSTSITIRNQADEVVYQSEFPEWNYADRAAFFWLPRTRNNPVPEGTYKVTATMTDRAGNTTEVDRWVDVSHLQRKMVTWSRTVRAGEVLIEKNVGRCASLKRPARARWRGSLGYRSDGSCSRARQTVVSTVHGVYIPYSHRDRYEVRVSAWGGAGRGAPGSSLQMFYMDRGSDWEDGGRFKPSLGLHHGYDKRSAIVQGQDDREPYVIWTVGLGGGYRYDVKHFTVRVRYLTLAY